MLNEQKEQINILFLILILGSRKFKWLPERENFQNQLTMHAPKERYKYTQ